MYLTTDALKNMPTLKNEASDSLAERLAAYLKNKTGRDEA